MTDENKTETATTTETATETATETRPAAPVKEMSLSQFKSWLEGVEEMQDADWHPSATQWNTIRAKFDSITEPKPVPAAAPAPLPVAPLPMHQPPVYREREWTNPPPMPETEISPAAKAIMSGGTPAELDTTDGNYDSSFG